MKIQVFSDIHGEAYHDPALIWNFIIPQAPVAVVAGDIDARKFEATVNEIATKFERVICVLGNHEYYHKNIRWKPKKNDIPDNVTILNRDSFEFEGVTFIGCTLWTDMKKHDWFVVHAADKGINDFYMITDKKVDDHYGTKINRFTAHACTELHRKEKAYLNKMIELNRGKKLVLVTHFMPTYAVVADRWKTPANDTLNHYFAANCDDIIEKCEEGTTWIFGHTHDHRDMMIGNVHMVCNPYGYPGENRNTYKDMVIDL